MPSDTVSADDLEALLAPTSGPEHMVDQTDSVLFTVDGVDGDGVEADAAGGGVPPAGFGVATLASVVGEPRAHLQLLAVDPSLRRSGVARSIVAATEQWAWQRGSATLTIGAGAPFYLFTGVDSRWTEALCCFEALGYERVDTELDLSCPTRRVRSGRPATGAGVDIEAVRDDAASRGLAEFADASWPTWSAEFARAAAAGTVFVARDPHSGAVLGAAAHSVGRLGVIGPVAVDPAAQGRGVGTALMDAVLSELSVAGVDTAEIAWTSTVRFYSLACGATAGRASVVLRRELGE